MISLGPGQWPLASPLEVKARDLCRVAGENPDEPRWRAYLEQAKATLEAEEKCPPSSGSSPASSA